jgi:uroporphyrinogen-III synthase
MARTVLVTRTADDCVELQEMVRHADITLFPYPVLTWESVDDEPGWASVLERVREPSFTSTAWLALVSPRAPQPFAGQARRRGAGLLLTLPAAAVGQATARAAAAVGLDVRLVGTGTGGDLAEPLCSSLTASAPVVLACGHDRRPELPEALVAAGHAVHVVEVYRMRPTSPSHLPPLPERVEGVVLTSPRAATLYLARVGGSPLPCPHWVFGPTTRDAAAALGIPCRATERPDLQSLAEALCVS